MNENNLLQTGNPLECNPVSLRLYYMVCANQRPNRIITGSSEFEKFNPERAK